jgi:hypothetical protein
LDADLCGAVGRVALDEDFGTAMLVAEIIDGTQLCILNHNYFITGFSAAECYIDE